MQAITTDKAPKAIGPYSQAVLADGLLFISGQLGIDPATSTFQPDFTLQTEQVFANLKAILEEAGMSFANVLKVSIFMKDLSNFQTMNQIYAKYFSAPYPAREAYEVARLPVDGLIEISCIAKK